ncbi:MAG: S9 family peptidase [Holophagaceae bacterium]|nr:S9 family peptidase [Holophagaceae bacterium]
MRTTRFGLLAFSCAAALLAQSSAPPAAAPRARIAWTDLEKTVGLAEPRIAPDGKSILVTLSRTVAAENRTDRELDLVDAATGALRVLVKGRKGLGQARWSPDGSRVAFLADVDGKAQLLVLPMAGGEAQAITKSPTGVQQFTWSPDGRRFAFTQSDEVPKLPEDRKGEDGFEAGDDDLYADAATPPVHAWVISAEGGEARRLTSGTWSLPILPPPNATPSPLAWSPDGSRLAYVRQATPHSGDQERSSVQVLDLATGISRPLTGQVRFESNPSFTPDGKGIAYVWAKGGDPTNLPHVYLADAGGGSGRDLTAALDGGLDMSLWTSDGKAVLVGGNDQTRIGLWAQPLDGPARRVDLGDLVLSGTSAGDLSMAAGGALAFVARTATHPGELFVMDSLTAKPRRLTNLNAHIDALDLGRVERVTWKGPEGQPEDGVLTYPPDFQPGRKYPLALVIHGGPTSASLEAWAPNNQLLAAKGFLVFNPNYRGSDNLGNAYAKAIINDAGEGPGRDVMAGVEALKARGIVDEARMVVSGWSYGGYMTTWLLGRYPALWKAGVAGAPVTDMRDQYAFCDFNQGERLAFWEGIEPYDGGKGEAAFRDQSPISLARHITAPTLIMSMNHDYRVPPTQSYKLYRVLKDKGVEVKFYAWPQRGHGPGTPARRRQVFTMWVDWLTARVK